MDVPLLRRLDGRPLRHRVAGWHHRLRNRRLGDDEIQFVRGPRLRIHPDARMAFNFHAMHTPEMVQELRGFLALTQSGRCLVDVGAHYGLFSLVFSSRPGTVAYAVEPSPEARRMLEHHLAVNPGLDVRVWPVALGRSQGELTFSIGEWGHALRSPGAELVTLPVRTLDGLVDEERARPDAVKIDVEGMELEVLEGARKTLSELRPQIFLEVHPSELVASGRRVAEVDALLRAAGYSVRDSGAEPVSDLEAFCNGAIRRVVATHRGDGRS